MGTVHVKKQDNSIIKLIKRFVSPTKSSPKQQVSEFVKKMRALSARLEPRLVWNSQIEGNYVKRIHGLLE